MTLVLSMNPFCDHEAEAPPPHYQPIWESEHCSKSCVSTPTPSGGDAQELTDEPPCRRAPDHVTVSRIAYFKRKYVEDDDLPLTFRSYCHTVPPVLEEHAHILRLSLEKMRFIDDPEAFLRRSVLINNLLRRLRTEILLQRDWRFPPGPAAVPCAISVASPAPVSAHGHTPPQHPSPASRPCFALPSPHRKRLRLLRGEAAHCVPTCCCLFAAGRYLQLPLCVYEGAAHCLAQPSSSSSTSSSSSSSPFPVVERFEQLLDEEEEEDEDEDEDEEESDGEEGLDSLCPGLDLCEVAVRAESRERARTRAQTREPGLRVGVTRGREREKQRGRGGETIVAGSSRWMADGMEMGHQGALVWAQEGRK
ncbi:SERTA domain-containing protein 4 [Brachyhypopomus gauderio]|uniref:SERTA domain-containing protein 4 n=1 Tax=Brachyhypopomus gauderio TaxID=698409 RepID=UPI004041EE7D